MVGGSPLVVCRGEPDVSASGAIEDFLIRGQRKEGRSVLKKRRSDRRHLVTQPHGRAQRTPSNIKETIAEGGWKKDEKKKKKKKKESLEETRRSSRVNGQTRPLHEAPRGETKPKQNKRPAAGFDSHIHTGTHLELRAPKFDSGLFVQCPMVNGVTLCTAALHLRLRPLVVV